MTSVPSPAPRGLFPPARVFCLNLLALIGLLTSPALPCSRADEPAIPTIRLVPGDGDELAKAAFEVVGLDRQDLAALKSARLDTERAKLLFSVRVETKERLPAMLGKYRVVGDAFRFDPRFPLQRGLAYLAEFDPSKMPGNRPRTSGVISARFKLPEEKDREPTHVVRIDPGGQELPDNLLRVYLHFSAPMARGEIYQRVHVLDGQGKPLSHPFLELGEELWNPEGTRATLLFDPGRIKRGLRPREEAGPILEAGKSYEIAIDRQWPDAHGTPLREDFRRKFLATEADMTPIDPAAWSLRAPRTGTKSPLILDFGEPLDRGMLDRVLTVLDPEGKVVAGRIDIPSDATRWWFRPEQAWTKGEYRLQVPTNLEDLAGNQVGRPFEVDEFEPVTSAVRTPIVELRFTPGPPLPAGARP